MTFGLSVIITFQHFHLFVRREQISAAAPAAGPLDRESPAIATRDILGQLTTKRLGFEVGTESVDRKGPRRYVKGAAL